MTQLYYTSQGTPALVRKTLQNHGWKPTDDVSRSSLNWSSTRYSTRKMLRFPHIMFNHFPMTSHITRKVGILLDFIVIWSFGEDGFYYGWLFGEEGFYYGMVIWGVRRVGVGVVRIWERGCVLGVWDVFMFFFLFSSFFSHFCCVGRKWTVDLGFFY